MPNPPPPPPRRLPPPPPIPRPPPIPPPPPPPIRSVIRRPKPRAFIELCCGSAAVTLQLLGGQTCTPPISYMGSKRAYAPAILSALGLQPGQGAERVLLADAGPWGEVWQALVHPEAGAAVAARILSWRDEEPKALWDRLKAAGAADALTQSGVLSPTFDVAGWLTMAAWSYAAKGPQAGYGRGTHGSADDCPACGGPCRMTVAATAEAVTRTAAVFDAVGRVAGHLVMGGWAYEAGNPRTGFIGPGSTTNAPKTVEAIAAGALGAVAATTSRVAAVRCDVRQIPPPDDAAGIVVYMDPPYAGTTGYIADLPRADVIAVARRWAEAGALVCVSEAEPLEIPGWTHLEIDHARLGTSRTFSKQQAEWLTMSRFPGKAPPKQASLF